MGGGGGNSGGGSRSRISTKKAKEQLSARQSEFSKSAIGRVPGMSSLMGNISLASQQKALDEGGTAIAVPGTAFAPQGQAYTEAPGMRSSRELASKGFKVGQTMDKEGTKTTIPTRPGMMPVTTIAKSQFVNVPSGSIGQYSAFKKGSQTGMGYVGDVAGVTRTREVFGVPVTTFTGKTGYSPSGEKIDKPTGGGAKDTPVVATEPEVTPEVTPEVVPDETVLAGKARRTRYKRVGAGGTILEGFGALYK
jgi:hypothetical protein